MSNVETVAENLASLVMAHFGGSHQMGKNLGAYNFTAASEGVEFYYGKPGKLAPKWNFCQIRFDDGKLTLWLAFHNHRGVMRNSVMARGTLDEVLSAFDALNKEASKLN